jgi:hypothetical protein
LSGEILDADAVALGQGASQQGSAVAARIPPLLVIDAGDCLGGGCSQASKGNGESKDLLLDLLVELGEVVIYSETSSGGSVEPSFRTECVLSLRVMESIDVRPSDNLMKRYTSLLIHAHKPTLTAPTRMFNYRRPAKA